jgi:hypothetical protein
VVLVFCGPAASALKANAAYEQHNETAIPGDTAEAGSASQKAR